MKWTVNVRSAFQPAYEDHVSNYENHACCDICPKRHKTCLVRGDIPADVLFIGEAPGDSEDVLGLPFVGPAGDLLSELIIQAHQKCFDDFGEYNDAPWPRCAFGNLLACVPRNDLGKIRAPSSREIKSCQPRLIDLVDLIRPRLVVLCGLVPQKHFPRHVIYEQRPEALARCTQFVDIPHPSSALRAEDAHDKARIEKTILLTLASAFKVLV
jgi:DNA polymerase